MFSTLINFSLGICYSSIFIHLMTISLTRASFHIIMHLIDNGVCHVIERNIKMNFMIVHSIISSLSVPYYTLVA